MQRSNAERATGVQRGRILQRRWGHFQLLVLFGGIGLVLVASVHMVGVAVSSQPDCVLTGIPGKDNAAQGTGLSSQSYLAAKRSC